MHSLVNEGEGCQTDDERDAKHKQQATMSFHEARSGERFPKTMILDNSATGNTRRAPGVVPVKLNNEPSFINRLNKDLM
jgi:hypothetical protein